MRQHNTVAAFCITLAAASAAPAQSSTVAAPRPLPTVEQQIAASVLALPADLRAGATVMGYRTAGKLETIRPGTNGMNCLALFAIEADFHVACYHEGMEPFMARGRDLRAQGVKGTGVDSVRFAEVASGKLPLPKMAAMYQIFGSATTWDAATGKIGADARTLLVVYIPNATPQTTGLSPVPSRTGPWIMFPGTPKAHIMVSGTMSP
jgi:hypothetical protein